jgi:hypothetical protein
MRDTSAVGFEAVCAYVDAQRLKTTIEISARFIMIAP